MAIAAIIGCVIIISAIGALLTSGGGKHTPTTTPSSTPLSTTTTTPASTLVSTRVIQDDQLLLYNANSLEQSLATIHNLGYTTVRVDARWSQLAPSSRPYGFDPSDPSTYNQAQWYSLDRLVRRAGYYHLQVMIDITGPAPGWALTRGMINLTQWRDFVGVVAQRYDGRYSPPNDGGELPAVNTFSIWDEPNLARSLAPQTGRPLRHYHRVKIGRGKHRHSITRTTTTIPLRSPAIYRALYLDGYSAIIGKNTQAAVYLGELAPSTNYDPNQPTGGGIAPLSFLRALACVNGRLRPITSGGCAHYIPLAGAGVAVHAFSFGQQPTTPSADRQDLTLGDLPRLETLLAHLVSDNRISSGLNHIAVTEFGYPTSGRDAVSLAQQGPLLLQAQAFAASQHVVMFGQYLLEDQTCQSGVAPCEIGDTGLQTSTGNAKPAEKVIAQAQFGASSTQAPAQSATATTASGGI
jgi:hypothetical protein